MATIEEIEEKLRKREERKAIVLKKIEQYKEEQEMPLYLLLQKKESNGQYKYKEKMKRLKLNQETAMNSIIKKRHKNFKGKEKETFEEFWDGFLLGKYKSINEFFLNCYKQGHI